MWRIWRHYFCCCLLYNSCSPVFQSITGSLQVISLVAIKRLNMYKYSQSALCKEIRMWVLLTRCLIQYLKHARLLCAITHSFPSRPSKFHFSVLTKECNKHTNRRISKNDKILKKNCYMRYKVDFVKIIETFRTSRISLILH